jgi:hypothetical protein
MNYFLIALSSLAVTQTALAKISPQTLASNNSAAVHANEPLFKANIGFIINNETNEVYCKFNRDNSPGSFPPFSGASYENQQGFDSQSSQYSSVSNCTQDQLAFSESIAQQSMNDNLKLAGLPIAAGVAICTLGIMDGAAFSLTAFNENPTETRLYANIGSEGVAWAAYQWLIKANADNAVVLAGLKSIVKINFYCTGLGMAAGGATRGLMYLINR